MDISGKEKNCYIAPTVHMIKIVLEKGFALSPPTPGSGDIEEWDTDTW